MTTFIIILALIALSIWGVARVFRNKNAPEIEAERTERQENRRNSRRRRWPRWGRRDNDVPRETND